MGDWTLFSNHGHVLVCLARNNESRLRDVATVVGITERAVQKIVKELQEAGLISVSKHGRCNRYRINSRKSLRHPLEAHCTIGRLLQLVSRTGRQPAEVAVVKPKETVASPPPATKPTTAAVEPAPDPESATPKEAVAVPPKVEPPPATPPIAPAISPDAAAGKPKSAPESAETEELSEPKDAPDSRKQGSLF